MPLRTLFRYLANNERLVQRLAESYPVRRAAQFTIYLFYKGKDKLSDVDPQKVSQLLSFLKRLSRNIKEELQEAKKQLKK